MQKGQQREEMARKIPRVLKRGESEKFEKSKKLVNFSKGWT
jgi:hypothetical protein